MIKFGVSIHNVISVFINILLQNVGMYYASVYTAHIKIMVSKVKIYF